MKNYIALPAARMPDNALIDMSGAYNALETLRQQNNLNEERRRQDEERAYQRSRAATADARAERAFRLEDAKRMGAQAFAIDQLQGDLRTASWNRFLSLHPDRANLPPQYLDPLTGPKLVAAEAGQWRDPREDQLKDLAVKKAEAEIARLQKDAAGEGADYGKTGTIFQGPDGQFYAARFAADGSQRIVPIGQGMTPFRGTEVVGEEVLDRATGETVRNVAPQIAGGERAKIVGRETGEGQMQLPKLATALQQYDIQTDSVLSDIERAKQQAGPWTTGFFGNLGSYVPGTPSHDLAKRLTAIQSNLGFETLQQMRDNSPTGGALGQVTEKEIELLQSAWGSLAQSQSVQQFRENLDKIARIKNAYRKLKREAYEHDVARFGAGNVPNPEGIPAAPQSPPKAPANTPFSIRRLD